METQHILYIIIVIIAIALISKIAEDVQKGIAEGNEKKRQKDLLKEVNDSNNPNNKVCCRFCVHWTKVAFNETERHCNSDCAAECGEKTDADHSCYYWEEIGSIEEARRNH